jgi:hypothetical protein
VAGVKLSSEEWRERVAAGLQDFHQVGAAVEVDAGLGDPVDDAGFDAADRVDPSDWHLDHIVPISRGGTHEPANVQVSHPRCNQSKAAKILEAQTTLAISHTTNVPCT